MRRALIFLLAMAWGYLTYALHQGLGYGHATGYPSLFASLTLAVPLTLPLVIGGIYANHHAGWRKYLRWGGAALMAAEAGGLLVFSWLKIFAFPPLLGTAMLLWPGQRADVPPLPRRQRLMRSGLWFAGGGLLVWRLLFSTPSPATRRCSNPLTPPARTGATGAGIPKLPAAARPWAT